MSQQLIYNSHYRQQTTACLQDWLYELYPQEQTVSGFALIAAWQRDYTSSSFPWVQSNRIRGEEITDLLLLSCHEPYAKGPFAEEEQEITLCLFLIYEEVSLSLLIFHSLLLLVSLSLCLSLFPPERQTDTQKLWEALIEHIEGEITESFKNSELSDRMVWHILWLYPSVHFFRSTQILQWENCCLFLKGLGLKIS